MAEISTIVILASAAIWFFLPRIKNADYNGKKDAYERLEAMDPYENIADYKMLYADIYGAEQSDYVIIIVPVVFIAGFLILFAVFHTKEEASMAVSLYLAVASIAATIISVWSTIP